MITTLLLDVVAQAHGASDWIDSILDFVDTPAPYSPFSEYLFVLFVLWLIARRSDARKKSFERQAQEILDEKLESGELSRKAYDKFRQDMALRPKR